MPVRAPTYAQVRRFVVFVVRALYRLEVVGAERVPPAGPLVVVANHDSLLDGFVLGSAIERELRFLGKSELWRFPPLGWALDGLGVIRIERGRGDGDALARAGEVLAAGEVVAVFPQGSVRRDRVWHRGAARIALAAGAPVLPVRLVGTGRALSRGRISFPRLRAVIGEPLRVDPASDDPDAATELTERLRVAVESLT